MKFNDHYHLDFTTQRVAVPIPEFENLNIDTPTFMYMENLAKLDVDPWEIVSGLSRSLDTLTWEIWLGDRSYPITLAAKDLVFYVSINDLPSDILEKAVKSSHFKDAISTSRKLDNSIESATAAAFQAEIDLKKMDMPFDIDKFLARVKDLYLNRDVLMKEHGL